MKFGKQIQVQQIPEWQSHYMSYKGLKKIINSLIHERAKIPVATSASASASASPALGSGSGSGPVISVSEDESSTCLQSQKAAFFFKLERELEKVNLFYLRKESELNVRLRTLIDKEKVILSRQGRPGTGSSISSLKEAYQQFERDLNKLQKFVETNGTAFRKILKKWDKRAKSSTKELYLSRQIDLQPCFNQDAMVELADSAARHLLSLDNFEQGRPSSTLSSPVISIKPEQQEQQQKTDDLESDLFHATTTHQSILLQEIINRRVLALLSNPTPGASANIENVSNEQELEWAREALSRVFWRCCSEPRAPEDLIQKLVETGLINFKLVDDISDRTCLHEAAIVGRLSLLKLCVEQGVSPDCMDVYGRRPLHYAAMFGYADCATYLLSLGASLVAKDHDGFQPLIYSVVGGHTRCVEIFLNNGVDTEAYESGDPIPLSLACHYGHEDIAMLLISRGANLIASNADGLEPLHITCREGHTRLTEMLTLKGARLNQEDKYMCWTPLFYAASEGHVDCVMILLQAGCSVKVLDEHGKTPIYYAASEGHSGCVDLLVDAGGKAEGGAMLEAVLDKAMTLAPGLLDASGLSEVEDKDGLDMDIIPSLSLPPPIIPFRIYGHNYLDKKYQINIKLGHISHEPAGAPQNPVRMYGTAQTSSLRLVISPRPDSGMIPHNVILPLSDNRRVHAFQVGSLDQFMVEFEIFPTFGSKAIGRAVALPSTFSSPTSSLGKDVLPLFNTHLKVVGELAFEFNVIRPFEGVNLEVGGRLETYWKSTNSVDSVASSSTATPPIEMAPLALTPSAYRGILPGPASQNPPLIGNAVPSYITASSLSGEYIQLSIQMTRDMVPVVFSEWRLPVEGFDLALSDVTLSQFTRFRNVGLRKDRYEDLQSVDSNIASAWSSAEWRRRIYNHWMELEQVLRILPKHIGVNLELKYPTAAERQHYRLGNTAEFNKFVDTTLQIAYDSSSPTHHRSFIFSSFNPIICSALNWKQPNYAVFFNTFGRYNNNNNNNNNNNKDTRTATAAAASTTATTTTAFVETDRRCTSIKEAIKFARSNNLLGLICEATPLLQVPSLITNIKESGLILTSFGISNRDPTLVQIQKSNGVDAFMVMDSSGSSNRYRYERERGHPTAELDFTANTGAIAPQIAEVEEGVLRYQNGTDV
ncbi:phosphate system positive regulatory protein pho81 [Dissophora globulifera]|nr:phosphate system positive regulatory protein pho81 [Dissophora globulifera]